MILLRDAHFEIARCHCFGTVRSSKQCVLDLRFALLPNYYRGLCVQRVSIGTSPVMKTGRCKVIPHAVRNEMFRTHSIEKVSIFPARSINRAKGWMIISEWK